jgi:hypothetical protein
MANLPENSTFDVGVYQIETTDYVQGGLAGTSNKQAQSLANRTKYLKDLMNNAGFPKLLGVSGSINAISATGFFFVAPSNGLPNIPGTGASAQGFLQHMEADSNNATQILHFLGVAVSMQRHKVSGAWGAWFPLNAGQSITGMIATFPAQSAPAGWLPCNGALVSRATYADLWNAALTLGPVVTEAEWSSGRSGAFSSGNGSTNFRLMDLRGEFIRGWDSGRGVDAGRVIGSFQSEMVGAHTHPYIDTGMLFVGNANFLGGGTWDAGEHNRTTSVNSGTENRPRNIALAFYIKY